MNLLIFSLLVFVVVALACWIIHFIPLPAEMSPNTKSIAMGLVCAIGLVVILLAALGGIATPVIVAR
jgi:hypothetical protein